MNANGEIKIEKGIPVPSKGHVRGGIADVIRSLAIGDSFLAPRHIKQAGNLFTYAKFAGFKITTRKQNDGRFRVWRIA